MLRAAPLANFKLAVVAVADVIVMPLTLGPSSLLLVHEKPPAASVARESPPDTRGFLSPTSAVRCHQTSRGLTWQLRPRSDNHNVTVAGSIRRRKRVQTSSTTTNRTHNLLKAAAKLSNC